MKRTLLTIALLSTFPFAYAGNCGNDKDNGNASCQHDPSSSPSSSSSNAKTSSKSASNSASNSQSSSVSNNKLSAKVKSESTSSSGDTASSATSEGSTNSQSLTLSHTERPATAYAPPISPTAQCALATGIGIQGAFGFSFGASYVEKNCVAMETAKTLWQLGQTAVAMEVMCTIPSVREARATLGDPCKTPYDGPHYPYQ